MPVADRDTIADALECRHGHIYPAYSTSLKWNGGRLFRIIQPFGNFTGRNITDHPAHANQIKNLLSISETDSWPDWDWPDDP